ncbi:MAG: cold shock protein [Flavipsychrobacter sp.]|jgi:cold shock CspA family protein|nr:cold shock protein [Flavipsychrobacter sp.]
MSRAKETVGKKEKEKKKAQKKRAKEEKREERKVNNNKGKSLEDMMMYLDENGNLSPTPPDPAKKVEIELEDIQLGAAKFDPEEDGLRKGVVTFYNEAKGYGFINDLRSQKSIFFHANNCTEPIKERHKVSFEIEQGPKGPTAVKVSVIK